MIDDNIDQYDDEFSVSAGEWEQHGAHLDEAEAREATTRERPLPRRKKRCRICWPDG